MSFQTVVLATVAQWSGKEESSRRSHKIRSLDSEHILDNKSESVAGGLWESPVHCYNSVSFSVQWRPEASLKPDGEARRKGLQGVLRVS